MSEWSQSLTRTSDAQDLWTYQLKGKDTVNAITALFADEGQTLETVAAQVQAARAIDTATGINLDRLGTLVGQPREGRSDAVYRLWIKARIRVNRSSGSPPDMYAVARLILGADVGLWLRQMPVGHVLQVSEFVDADLLSVQRILQQTSAVAVPFALWHAPYHDEIFTFAAGSTPVAASAVGFDGGRLRGAIDAQSEADPIPTLEDIFGSDLIEKYDFSGLSAGDVENLDGLASNLTYDTTAPVATSESSRDQYSSLGFAADARMVDTSPDATLLAALDGATGFTLAWVGSRRASGTITAAFSASETGYADEIRTGFFSSNIWFLYLEGGGSSTFNGPTVSDTDTHTFVLSYDGSGTCTFYVDGEPTQVTGTDRSPTIERVMLGNLNTFSQGWGTFGGEFVIVGRAITEDEATAAHTYLSRTYTDNY